MGTDAMAVVDPETRVHGLQNLRVVDSSIFPTIPNGNLNAPTIMLAERRGYDLEAEMLAPADSAVVVHRRLAKPHKEALTLTAQVNAISAQHACSVRLIDGLAASILK